MHQLNEKVGAGAAAEGRSVEVGYLAPDVDETGTSSLEADLDAAEVLAAVGRLPVNLAVFTVPPHSATMADCHASQELWLVQRGHGVITCGGREHPARPGGLYALPGGEEHRLHTADEEMTVLSIWWRGADA
ncbi:cupin domain-containing protein [Kitasatospora sp. NPDC098652]|uniref:cupin domain-containing protein n=1 Tax=Kitasatospora sp. NPDC098652 TaxID=3364095 RepID=UPI00382D7FCE